MGRKQIQKPLIAGSVIGLIAVAGTCAFVVRELLRDVRGFVSSSSTSSPSCCPPHSVELERVSSKRMGSVAIFSNQKGSDLNMGYDNRNKPERKSGRVGFVEGRLNELRRRWENAADEREKSELSEKIHEWRSFRPERSAPTGGGRQ
jgi:hypothetical protein